MRLTLATIAAFFVGCLIAASCEPAGLDGLCADPLDDKIVHYHPDFTATVTCHDDLDGDPGYPTVISIDEREPSYPSVGPGL